MTFNHPIEINFYELLKKGRFDYLKFGQSKEWILNNFPDPDTYGVNVSIHLSGKEAWMHPRCNIWKYGDIELYFYEDNILYMIFCDGFSWCHEGKWHSHEITGGKTLKLDKWIFQPVRKLNLPFVMETLLANGMHFTTDVTCTGAIELTIKESNFTFHFEPLEEDRNNIKKFRCGGFWLKEK